MAYTDGELLAELIGAECVLEYIGGLIRDDWEVTDEHILPYSYIEMDFASITLVAKDGRRYTVTVTEKGAETDVS